MSFIDQLLAFDTEIFLFLNGLHTTWLDYPMYFISKILPWIPLYLGVAVYIAFKWKKQAIWIILALILCLVFTDQITNFIKHAVERPRPSREPALAGLVHHVKNYRGGGFSFVSGHASNVFGFALLSSLILKNKLYTPAIFTWAAIVSYSRIYLGVHYPLDILSGMILGSVVAVVIYTVLQAFQIRLKNQH